MSRETTSSAPAVRHVTAAAEPPSASTATRAQPSVCPRTSLHWSAVVSSRMIAEGVAMSRRGSASATVDAVAIS